MLEQVRSALRMAGVSDESTVQYAKLPGRMGLTGRIVLACFLDQSSVPAYVVKLARDGVTATPMAREFDQLASIHAAVFDTSVRNAIPKAPVFLSSPPLLVQTYVGGSPSFPQLNSRSWSTTASKSLNWLFRFHASQKPLLVNFQERVRKDVSQAIDRISIASSSNRIPGLDQPVAEALDRVEEECGASRAGEAALVIIHGDFNPFNLMLSRATPTGVVDWEDSRLDFPAFDYFNYFTSIESLIANYGRRFDEVRRASLALAQNTAAGLDDAATTALFGTFLLQQCAKYLEREALPRHNGWWLRKMTEYARGRSSTAATGRCTPDLS